jgi:hypothetical protein
MVTRLDFREAAGDRQSKGQPTESCERKVGCSQRVEKKQSNRQQEER